MQHPLTKPPQTRVVAHQPHPRRKLRRRARFWHLFCSQRSSRWSLVHFVEAMPRHHESSGWCVASLQQSEPMTTKMSSGGKIDAKNGLCASKHVKDEGGSTMHHVWEVYCTLLYEERGDGISKVDHPPRQPARCHGGKVATKSPKTRTKLIPLDKVILFCPRSV